MQLLYFNTTVTNQDHSARHHQRAGYMLYRASSYVWSLQFLGKGSSNIWVHSLKYLGKGSFCQRLLQIIIRLNTLVDVIRVPKVPTSGE